VNRTTRTAWQLTYERSIEEFLLGDLDIEALLSLISAASWMASLDRTGHVPTGEIVDPNKGSLPRTIDAPAGAWVHETYRDNMRGEKPYRWHVFTGDVAWRPGWRWVRGTMLCGHEVTAGEELVYAEQPPDGGACRICVRRLGASADAEVIAA